MLECLAPNADQEILPCLVRNYRSSGKAHNVSLTASDDRVACPAPTILLNYVPLENLELELKSCLDLSSKEKRTDFKSSLEIMPEISC